MNKIINIDAFYKFVKVEGKKTKFQCVNSTGNYEPFEIRRNKKNEMVCYFSDADYTREIRQRKERWKMSMSKFHVSKVRALISDLNKAYGDVYTTNDLLLFKFNEEITGFTEVKVFIAKGMKNDYAFVQMFIEGGFDEEIKLLEDRATPE